jgi:hypothetical protein
MLFNKVRSRPHAQLYEVVAFSFFDSNRNFKRQSKSAPRASVSPQPNFNRLERAWVILAGRNQSVGRRVVHASEESISEENAEIAKMHPAAVALLPCEVRFEVLIDDLEAVLEDYRTLFAVQEALVEATGGFVFHTWNSHFPWSD